MRELRLNVAYAVPPGTRKAAAWRDGFTAAVEWLARRHSVRWLNLHPDDPGQQENLARLGDCDFLLAKSNWGWMVDELVRERSPRSGVPRGIMISGVADPPRRRRRLRFYDVLFYETDWYAPRLRRHPRRVHAFGVDTRVMHPDPSVERDVDWLSVGALRRYKRHERLLGRRGRRVVLGELAGADPQLRRELEKGGVEVRDFVPYEQLAGWYRRARRVLAGATVEGGGERSVLEARSCGAAVEVAPDNPKLAGLARQPVVWDHEYFGERLEHGIAAALAVR
jgi:hypothetical protein